MPSGRLVGKCLGGSTKSGHQILTVIPRRFSKSPRQWDDMTQRPRSRTSFVVDPSLTTHGLYVRSGSEVVVIVLDCHLSIHPASSVPCIQYVSSTHNEISTTLRGLTKSRTLHYVNYTKSFEQDRSPSYVRYPYVSHGIIPHGKETSVRCLMNWSDRSGLFNAPPLSQV